MSLPRVACIGPLEIVVGVLTLIQASSVAFDLSASMFNVLLAISTLIPKQVSALQGSLHKSGFFVTLIKYSLGMRTRTHNDVVITICKNFTAFNIQQVDNAI